MNYKPTQILFLSVLVVFFLYGLSSAQDVVRVKRVVDGDTLLLTNGERVRLIGMVRN
jgi:endonuclease YncB( thermonuclease family)